MRYALLISEDENVVINAEDQTARAAAFSAFLEEMQARGALLGVSNWSLRPQRPRFRSGAAM